LGEVVKLGEPFGEVAGSASAAPPVAVLDVRTAVLVVAGGVDEG
jgi:hypothetical protein